MPTIFVAVGTLPPSLVELLLTWSLCPPYESSLTVAPAKAGAHNPKRQLLKQSRRPAHHNNIRRGVWVPAFAGTTWGENVRPRSRGAISPE